MTLVQYDPEQSMHDARARYFEVNHFGDNGGYDDAWVDFKLGPVPFPFPNSAPRVRAVRYHDLHHVLTGYDTDTLGEFEISAWEIAAGCKGYFAAWQLNLAGMLAGLFVAPRRIVRAFARGRHSDTLYDRPLEPLLASKLTVVRESMGVDAPNHAMSGYDVLLFVLAVLAGLASAAVMLPLALVFLPIGLLAFAYRRARAQKPAGT
jgi:hypothetical protein